MHEFLEVIWVIKNLFISVGAVAILIYTLWYFFLANWRKYPAGRRVLGFVSSLVAVLGYTILALVDGDTLIAFPENEPSLGRVLVGMIVYGAVAYSSVRLVITLIKSWHQGEVHTPTDPFIPDEKTDRRLRRAVRPPR